MFRAADGRAGLVHVQAGPSNGIMIAISPGLREGDRVITRPDDAVRDGARISMKKS